VAGKIVAVWNSPQPAWVHPRRTISPDVSRVRYDLGDQDQPCQVDTPPFGANLALRKVYLLSTACSESIWVRWRHHIQGEDSILSAADESRRKIDLRAPALCFPSGREATHKEGLLSIMVFDYGECSCELPTRPLPTIRYFGVPRHMFRNS